MKKNRKIIQMPRRKTVTFQYNTPPSLPSLEKNEKMSNVGTLREVFGIIL